MNASITTILIGGSIYCCYLYWKRYKKQTKAQIRSNKARDKSTKRKPPDPYELGEVFKFRSIGKCHSAFPDKRGVPRQALLAPSVKAYIQLEGHVSPDILLGVEEYSHVWVLFVFSRNTDHERVKKWVEEKEVYKGKIRPPRMNGKSTGIYSTRSPNRPNPIGLSLCSIVSIDIEKKRLYLAGVDLCDETPVLDIKPYHPCDRPNPDMLRYPEYVDLTNGKNLEVRFSAEAEAFLSLQESDKRQMIIEVVSQDFRGASQNRGSVDPSVVHFVNISDIQVSAIFNEENVVTVVHLN